MTKEINISLCMIARDNERTIGAALESALPWVDEIIVADTGSLDSTPKIAGALGARLFHTSWTDDFSAARNFSIEHARGKWVFWMDTDDTLPAACGQKLQQLGRQSHPANTMGFVMQVRCPTHGFNGIDEFTVVDHVKMFRNLPLLRFEGPIHEQILMPIRRLGGDIQWTDIYVVHSGAEHSPESHRRKVDRDLRILRKDLAHRPNHPFVLFNLAMTYAESGQYAEALTWTKRCLAASEPSESHVRKAYAYLANCHFQLGDHNGALEACREGKRLFPSDPELLFREAMVLHESGRLGESISRYLEILELENEDVFRSTDPGIKGFKCRFNLGIALRDANRPAEAECHWRSVLREVPSYVPACRALGEILLQQNRVTTAEIEAERMIASGKSKLEGLLLLAKVYEHRKNSRLTEHTLRECARLYPECEYVLEEYVRFCVRHGRLATAKDLLEQFVTKFPQNAAAHHNLAAVDYQLGDLPRAIVSLRESLHLRPESSGTLAFYESAAAEHHERTRTSSIPAKNRTRISVCYRGEAITVIEAARILSLYTARGFQVEVACNQVQELFFRAIGATIVTSSSERWEPKRSPYDPLIHQVPDWRMSNAGWNIGEAPLPLLCHAAELWHEFSTKRIELLEQVPKSVSMVVAKWLENAKRPIVVWQVNNQFSELISSHCDVSNGRSLISCLDDATVVVPSSSENVGRQIDVKFKYLSDLNIPDSPDLKITLLSQAKLVITDNRDLLQLAAACEVPAIGLWSGTDHPAKSAIPTPRQLNLRFGHTSSPNEHRWRIPWCLIQHEFGDAIADTVAKYTHAMLSEPRYLGPRSIAADVQLQHWISDLCHEGFQPVRDRGNSFSVLFQEIGRRFKNPTIVETGTIRALDDWAGAGYFTFLAGAYVYRAGGMLHSVDISGANCEFARQQCMPFCDKVRIHCNDSVAFLSSFPAKIDVLYCDSLDTYEPGFAEHAMREVQAAYHCLHEQAIIVFDDSPTDEGKLTGKGALAIPWLIEQGWRFLFSGYQQILVKID